MNNSGITIISGPVYISEGNVARSLTIAGAGNLRISGNIANNNGFGTNLGNFPFLVERRPRSTAHPLMRCRCGHQFLVLLMAACAAGDLSGMLGP